MSKPVQSAVNPKLSLAAILGANSRPFIVAPYNTIDGFDNEYGRGIAYDDDDFLRMIQETDALIITRDELETHHQWHSKISVKVPGYREKRMRNKNYYENKWSEVITL